MPDKMACGKMTYYFDDLHDAVYSGLVIIGIMNHVWTPGDQFGCGQYTETLKDIIFTLLFFCPFVWAAGRMDDLWQGLSSQWVCSIYTILM